MIFRCTCGYAYFTSDGFSKKMAGENKSPSAITLKEKLCYYIKHIHSVMPLMGNGGIAASPCLLRVGFVVLHVEHQGQHASFESRAGPNPIDHVHDVLHSAGSPR